MQNIKPIIFVVDDDLGFQSMMDDYLAKSSAYDIRVFSTGEDCLDHLYLFPEVIILDYHLDGIIGEAENGLVILQKIKEASPDTPVIMLSSQDKFGVAAQMIMKGAYGYIVKDEEAFEKAGMMLQELLAKGD